MIAVHSSPISEAAQDYTSRRGWAIIPIPHASKIPVLSEWQNLRLTSADLPEHFNGRPQNLGVLTGEPSHGLTDVDTDAPEAVRLAPKFLPDTASIFGRPSKPRSHYLYIAPDAVTEKFQDPTRPKDTAMLVELRSTGCQTVFPPSTHEKGETISWHLDGESFTIETKTLRDSVATLAAASLLSRHWPGQGSRHDAAMALSGGLLRGGWAVEKVEAFIEAVAGDAGDDQVQDRVKTVATTAQRLKADPETGELKTATGWTALAKIIEPRVVNAVRGWLGLRAPLDAREIPVVVSDRYFVWQCYHEQEYGDARLLAQLYKGQLAYDFTDKSWYRFGPHVWTKDETDLPKRLVPGPLAATYLQLSADITREAKELTDPDEAKKQQKMADSLMERARHLRFVGRTKHVLEYASGMLAADNSLWDSDPWLLGVLNGVIDLHTGELRDGRPDDRVRTAAPTEWKGLDEPAPRWEKALSEILAGNTGVALFLQRVFGYSMTGLNIEHILVILFGEEGRNGKDTILETLAYVLGRYAGTISKDVLVAAGRRDTGSATPHLVDLQGKRLVWASETSEKSRLDSEQVKYITGGGRIKGRALHANLIEFTPTHTTLLLTNRRPKAPPDDSALWDRVKLVEFTQRFLDQPDPHKQNEHKVNRKLLNELKTESSGILAWLVRGCLEWQRIGLQTPEAVRLATDQYRHDEDELSLFLDACCYIDATAQVRPKPWHSAYMEWATDEGISKPLTLNMFGRMMGKRFKKSEDKHGALYIGVGLLSDRPAPPPEDTPNAHENNVGGGIPPGGGNCAINRVFQSTGLSRNDNTRYNPQFPPPAEESTTRVSGEFGEFDSNLHAENPVDAKVVNYIEQLGINSLNSPNSPLITTADELTRVIPGLLASPVLGFDTETTGLDPLRDRLRLIQFATPTGQVVIDCFAVDPEPLHSVFEQAECIVGHNLKFDLEFLAGVGLSVPNGRRLFDTMLAAQLLGAGTPDGQLDHCGLAAVVKRYLDIEMDKRLQKSDWSGELTADQLRYAADDVSVLLPLADTLKAEIEKAGLTRAAAIEMRVLPALAWVERTGAPFDAEAWKALAVQAKAEQASAEAELTKLAGRVDLLGDSTINWGSHTQVKELLAERGHDVDNTDEAALQELADVEPLARVLLTYRDASKRASTYGEAFLKHVHPTTGRIHASYLQLGSKAGRMSCQRPNLQQIPRGADYRACFRPAVGRCTIKADYSQIELRIAAEITQDPRMLRAYQDGEDLHVVTAAAVMGKEPSEVTKQDRQAAKAVNFGLLYGMGAAGLRKYAKNIYGVTLTDEEANAFRARFFATYKGLKKWHGSQPQETVETRTIAGRRRLDVVKFTEKLNSPVQGTGADALKAALARMWETRGRCPNATPVLAVHDEIVVECPLEDAEDVKAWLVDCMQCGGRAFLKDVPVEVEAKIARDWSGTTV